MNSEELKKRTKRFALDIIKMVGSLPNNPAAKVIGNQLTHAATSVGANYRSACRGRSKADFISKITIVEEEADESSFWIELLLEAEKISGEKVDALLKESNELVAISVASIRTAKKTREPDSMPQGDSVPRSALRTPH